MLIVGLENRWKAITQIAQNPLNLIEKRKRVETVIDAGQKDRGLYDDCASQQREGTTPSRDRSRDFFFGSQ